MKIFLFAIGARDRASSRLRVWDHVEWLRAEGHAVECDSLTPRMSELTRASLARRILARLPRWIAAFFRADAIVVQETLLLWPLVPLRNLGKQRRLMFDFSDPVDRIHTGRGAMARLRAFAFDRMVRGADIVMVENRRYEDQLAGKARRIAHQYGPVDAARYGEGRARVLSAPRGEKDRPLRIGWTGSPGTYRFIAPLIPIIDRIAAHVPIEIALIGVKAIPETVEHAKLTLIDWTESGEFGEVPKFDLALFRLEPTEDARWRGAGKLFIYMASGVPFLATDGGIAHDAMRESRVGFAVADDAEWEQSLRIAIADEEERKRMSQASIAFAEGQLSYERYRGLLVRLIEGDAA
jgi:glycosyltransferase involved in cell wall biosynthesis